ncbi:MAG: tetratricopeptide repeat protein [Geminicoccaceae bacterium]
MLRALTLLVLMLPGLALAQARDDNAPAGSAGWMDRFFGYAAYKSGYYQRAIDLWLPLAEAGDARAQEFIGILHEEGHGVPKDIDKAMSWYERAALSGDMAAQYNLGRIYLEGKLVEQDIERAHELLRLAAEQGDEDAKALLPTGTH